MIGDELAAAKASGWRRVEPGPKSATPARPRPTPATGPVRQAPEKKYGAIPDTTPALSAALEYARRGWQVFPVHTPGPEGLCTCGTVDCRNAGKHPRNFNGVSGATSDREQIRKWWASWPTANIGIATGGKTGLFVVDVDARSGGLETLAALEAEHGDTVLGQLRVKSGGGGLHGYHRQLRSQTITSGANVLGPGIDIKGDGGYIIAPPSLHPSGNRYAWMTETGCLEKTDFAMDPPDWLIDRLANEERRCRDRIGGGTATGRPPFTLPDVIEPGARNDALIRVAGAIRRCGAGKDVILKHIREVNATRCRIPLDDRELERIATSAARYPPGDARRVPVWGRS